MTFSAYTAQDLMGILRQRAGDNVFEAKGLEMIARKCQSDGGDVRKARDFAVDAIQLRLDTLSNDGNDDSATTGPLVKLAHVAKLNCSNNRATLDLVSGLPQMCKSSLLVLTTLSKMQVTKTTIRQLRSFVAKCMTDEHEEEIMSMEDFITCLETLKDSGLLRIEAANLNCLSSHDQMGTVVQLGYQLQDAMQAVDKVCTGEYYRRIVHLVEECRDELALR